MKSNYWYWPLLLIVAIFGFSYFFGSMTASSEGSDTKIHAVMDAEHRRLFEHWKTLGRAKQQECEDWVRQQIGLPTGCRVYIASLDSEGAIPNDTIFGFVVIGTPANEKPMLPVQTLAFSWDLHPSPEIKRPLFVGAVHAALPEDIWSSYAPIANAVDRDVLAYLGGTADGKLVVMVTRKKAGPIVDPAQVCVWTGELGRPMKIHKVTNVQAYGPMPRVVITTDDKVLDWTLDGPTTYDGQPLGVYNDVVNLKFKDKSRQIRYRTPVPKDQDDVKVSVDGKDVSRVYHQ